MLETGCSMLTTCLKHVFTFLFTGSKLGWAFPKFHVIRHIIRLIIMYGCWEVCKNNQSCCDAIISKSTLTCVLAECWVPSRGEATYCLLQACIWLYKSP